MEELLMCSVCIERYHEKMRHPVLLPRCGHSFCRPCIAMLVSGGCVVCPTCRTDQRIDQVDRLPTEYTLLAIIHAQENNKKETCERHCVKLSFWCRTCEISTCGECLFEDHPTHSHDVIRASKYISDMKKNAQEVAIKFIEVLDEREQAYYKTIFTCTKKISNAIRNIGVLRRDMEEARELMKGIKEDETISAATSLSEAAKFLGLKWNIQDANFYRKAKEEKVKDEIDIEKEKAQAADAKEQEEKKAAKEKKEKRILRKSKTLSSVEMMKEADKMKDKAKVGADKPAKEAEAKPEDPAQKGKENADEKKAKEIPKPEEPKAAAKPEEPKAAAKPEEPNVAAKPEEPKVAAKPEETKVPVKQEEITIKDIIKMKDQLKKIEDPSNPDDVKETNNKLEKLPELTKVGLRNRFPKVKPIPKRPVPQQASPEAKSPVQQPKTPSEPLPVIQEKVKEEVVEALPAKPDSEPKENGINGISEDEESDTEEPATTEETSSAVVPADIINPDSGLSEDSKSNKPKDPLEDSSETEGKLTDFIQVPGFMICVEAADGRLGYMEWGPQGLHVHCLQFTHVTYDIVIRDNILNSMIPSKSPIVFLELTADQTVIGRVYIKLWGQLRRAHNFLSLCIGDQSKSFLNTKFLQVYNVNDPGERILGGDYETNNGRGGRGIIDDLEWNGDYAMPMKAGMITAAGSGQAATNSLFLLCTQSDLNRNFSCPFGLVCEGLNVVKEAVQETDTKQIWITDCGVLIVPPKFENQNST